MPSLNLGREPVAIIGAVNAALIAVQALALNIPAGVHAALAVVIVVLGVLLARSSVTPLAKPAAAVPMPLPAHPGVLLPFTSLDYAPPGHGGGEVVDGGAEMVRHAKLAEIRVEGKRLGRHIVHDQRSHGFEAERASKIVSVSHASIGLPLDQGQIGSCTANALVGALNTGPNVPANGPWTEKGAIRLYERETALEGQPYPPNDPGGSGLEVCKAAQQLGMIKSYAHAFSVDAALAALVLRPVITGVNWYTSFDTPDENGLVAIAPGATVRGGHEFVAVEIDAEKQLVGFFNSWGTSYGVGGRFYMSWATWAALLAEQGDVTIPVR